jgi:transposase
MSNFRPTDRDTDFLMPPSVNEWLPERHLARFIVEVVDGLDLRSMTGSYHGSGSASYHPTVLLGILVYGHATGVFSSRKLERATYDSVAFRFIAGNEHPDHDRQKPGTSLSLFDPGTCPTHRHRRTICCTPPNGPAARHSD